ncbi:AbrB/MazE/SpoVT family DNA-binding domain-containing protein [Halobacillus shinanisalinarum]|uniref:AbrB/MazE/SpoVT family DNA-binding domain-containing protein n=1 Tax=Halobacillus shinanisalinarum TaxID=2932258 RepID=UPI00272D0203|nr:AbrB/MazE/SpoVT family DNA-binding domain-containing protein [Halobacillus shinanisalinarum]
MKSTGIVRNLDDLGRIVIPIELRRTLDISEREPLEIFMDDEKIILRKYKPSEEKQEVLKDLHTLLETEKDPTVKDMLQDVIAYVGK